MPTIPDYECLRQIGRGAYGEVWLARNVTGSYVALKIVYRSAFEEQRPFEREFEGLKRFEPISRTDPSQTCILHVGRGEGCFYYVMELADDADGLSPRSGGAHEAHLGRAWALDPTRTGSYRPLTLKRLLLEHGPPPGAQCIQIVLSLARGLAYLHAHGLVHRDIKPSNVIFVKRKAKLADVGLVASVDATRSFVGTEGYFAPEGPGTPQADIYSLGKLLYEVSTGCDRAHFPALPPDIATRPDRTVLSELNAIVVRACQLDPNRRYPSAEAVCADLELLSGGRSVRRRQAVHRSVLLARSFLAVIGLITALFVGSYYLSWRARRQLTVAEYALSVGTSQIEAYKFYEKGRAAFLRKHAEALKQSVEFTRQAVRLDPRFSRAWGLLFWLEDGTSEQLKILATLQRLDPHSADTHAAQAWIAYGALDLRKADDEFRQSIARDRTCAWGRFAYAIFLTQCGRLKEARTELAELENLESSNNGVPAWLGDCFFVERRFDEAIAKYQESFQHSERAPRPHFALARAYEATGELDKAISEWATSELLEGADPDLVRRDSEELQTALREGGSRGYWSARLHQLERRSTPAATPYSFARLYARLGQQTQSLDLLETAWRNKDWRLRFLLIDEAFDTLRQQNRYTNLIERIGFQKDWPPK